MTQHGAIPSRIGEYDVQRVLGAGGMATVYAALQKQPRRTVAIKVMRYPSDAAALRPWSGTLKCSPPRSGSTPVTPAAASQVFQSPSSKRPLWVSS